MWENVYIKIIKQVNNFICRQIENRGLNIDKIVKKGVQVWKRIETWSCEKGCTSVKENRNMTLWKRMYKCERE